MKHQIVSFVAIIASLLLVAASCNNRKKQLVPPAADLQEMNRLAVKKEAAQIKQFIERNEWPAIKTGTGLYYYIYKRGNGDSAQVEQLAKVRMVITLLNGDTCYDWKKYGSEEFLIEKDNNESGLHEAIRYMRVGDRAKVVLPSYLAFGVAGDRDRIPPRHSVVYDIELLGLR